MRKPKVLFVGDSLAHNANLRKVERTTNTTLKSVKAYSSAWDATARFKDKNVTDVVKHEMKSGTFKHIVIAAPTVDISNLDTSQVKPTDDTENFKQKIRVSCKNLIKTAETALVAQPDLEKVTIMNHAPRYDASVLDPVGLKPVLANFANSFLLEVWLDSPMKEKIFIGSHNLDCTGHTRKERYTDERTGRYDGVHLYSSVGKSAYTDSVINILMSSFQTYSNSSNQPTDGFQTKQNGRKKSSYSSVAAGEPHIGTSNRFSPLNKVSGNY